jgi:flagellar hook-basal body complex protein FliE
MKIHNLGQEAMQAFKGTQNAPAQGKSDDFAQQLMDVLKEVNDAQQNARQQQTDLMTGRPVEVHDVMIAMERASIAMNLTMQVRNKVLEAYQEVMRTQI